MSIYFTLQVSFNHRIPTCKFWLFTASLYVGSSGSVTELSPAMRTRPFLHFGGVEEHSFFAAPVPTKFQTCKKTQPTFTRHLIAPPLQELCLGIIAKHLCIDCLQGWRATIHDLGTKDQTRSGSLSLMKTFENFWPQPPPWSTSHLWEECRSWEMQQTRRLESSSSLMTIRYYPPMKKKASGLNNRAWYVKNCAASLFRLACAKSSQNQNHGKKMVIEIWC